MSETGILNWEAKEVYELLTKEPNVRDDQIIHALANAMKRIADLEVKLSQVERMAKKAANDASCLANGIQPD